ncbi:hypothetical protein ACFQGA_09425 [Marinobacter koreensis]|uniref:Uncharacterized protein n=1 Tax=Marinobacter koreensis TaxID=335974 RepID=A0ABW0RLE3_9GAMM|nr:hypothetical protein [Marinobacter koreensis]MCK7547166.1 hypothetical protein [Marinobacter koreensis]
MNLKTLCDTLRPLFDLSTEVMETNFHYQQLLAERIQKAGKPLEQLTLAEVRQLVDAVSDDYEAATKPRGMQ